MISEEIQLFRNKLRQDPVNQNNRRLFHELFEWLESFWNRNYAGNNGLSNFSNQFDDFYWNIPELKKLSGRLCMYPPIGNSNNNFIPQENILRATYHLRHHSNLFDGINMPPVNDGDEDKGNLWQHSKLETILTIVSQIRNNLFHGRKMEVEEEQYQRNKELIAISVKISNLILENLVEAENNN